MKLINLTHNKHYMNNKQQFIITCRFPEWGYGDKKEYPAFGVKYLIEVGIDEEDVEKVFKEKYLAKIGKVFDGEILFGDEVSLINL